MKGKKGTIGDSSRLEETSQLNAMCGPRLDLGLGRNSHRGNYWVIRIWTTQ